MAAGSRQQAHPISSIDSRKKPRMMEDRTVTLHRRVTVSEGEVNAKQN